jgi:lipopolysaccharide transport system ATP-binding protein
LRDDLTGRENLIIDAEIQGQGRAEIAPRLQAMIEFAELGEFIDRPVRTYSSGMKARLAFTSLVFVEPEILLLDETLSVGDHWFAQKAFAAIRRLCAQGRIVMIVSHGLDSIVELCTRCLWLDSGRILADGDPAAVTSAYRATIRAREEAEFVRHFDVGPADGHGPVRQVSVVAGDGREPRAVLELGEPVHVRARIDRSATETDGEVHLRIERQDGIVVQWAHTRLQDLAPSASGGWLDIEASLGPALLRPSYYRVAIGLSGPSRRTTWASTTFKVISAHTPVGGDPALRWPIRMAARRTA